MNDNFNESVEKNLAISESRNLLSKNDAREISTYFEQIFSGY